MINTKSFRLAAVLVLIGEGVSTLIVLYIHPGGGETIEATFMNYAASKYWVVIHLAQFCGTAILLAGVLAFFHILKVLDGVPHWLGFFGSIAALVGLALAGVVFAVDGVANKNAVDAWATAPHAEQPTRLAIAEALRWIEIGTTSYLDIMLGLAIILLAAIVALTAKLPRSIGFLMALSGLGFIVVGWLVGTRGFTASNTVPIDAGYGFLFLAMILVLIHSWRAKLPAHSTAAPLYPIKRR
jgi:hypothetical protein